MDQALKNREDIEEKYKWDLESMYPDEAAWQADLDRAENLTKKFESFAGHLGDGADTLLSALTTGDELYRSLEKALVFARMRRDEDNGNDKAVAMCDKASSLAARLGARLAFFSPELLGLGEERIREYLKQEPGLEVYRFYLERMLREKSHILSDSEEALLARLSEVTRAPSDIFTMMSDVDLDFGTVDDENGKPVKVTHGSYINLLQSGDRRVREQAFTHMYNGYKSMANTVSTTYAASVKNDVISAQIRKYPSSREAALFGGNIPVSVYDNLVEQVNENLPALHKYLRTRKRVLGVEDLKMWDVYVPLVSVPRRTVTYEESQEIILKALAPMGDQYIKDLKEGFASRWADVYETPGKTSGAYSFGSYDSKPFVLLNYTDTLQDVFTVIHEMGHSMNSLYTRRAQPYIYGDHSIFTAEVASTVNENMLMKYLLSTETDPEMRKYLINMHIEAFRTTLFRQTMFAEFEDLVHRYVESGGSLTLQYLCSEYDKLNSKYFGDAVSHDDLIQYEWARIPHFYRAYYVYQYATGYSAASAISDKILADGPDDYLEFLKQGENAWPIDILKIAGVDMSTPEPVAKAMKTFTDLVDEFDELM